MTRLPYLKLVLASVAIGIVISVLMLQVDWFGPEGSTAAPTIDRMPDITLVVSALLFSLVCDARGAREDGETEERGHD